LPKKIGLGNGGTWVSLEFLFAILSTGYKFTRQDRHGAADTVKRHGIKAKKKDR
jgi:hypothetical protein